MTIPEVQTLIAVLEQQITGLLQDFQSTTGLVIHSVPISEHVPGKQVTARVKVQF